MLQYDFLTFDEYGIRDGFVLAAYGDGERFYSDEDLSAAQRHEVMQLKKNASRRKLTNAAGVADDEQSMREAHKKANDAPPPRSRAFGENGYGHALEGIGVPESAWLPDSSNCTFCSKGFSPMPGHWRHHCRGCGQNVCDKCSQNKIVLPWEFGYGPDAQRICTECHAKHKEQLNKSTRAG